MRREFAAASVVKAGSSGSVRRAFRSVVSFKSRTTTHDQPTPRNAMGTPFPHVDVPGK